MSQTPSAEDRELLESIRAGLRESVAFWAPENKAKREIYAVAKLLECRSPDKRSAIRGMGK